MYNQGRVHNDAPRVQALRAIKDWIVKGRFSTGEALPSERALSDELQVNRSSIRWALQALKEENLIRNQGPRTRVVTFSSESTSQNSLLHESVVILSPVVPPVDGNLRDPSKKMWATAIAQAAMAAVGEAQLHAIALHQDRLTDSVMDSVITGCPRGVVIPEINLNIEVETGLLRRLAENDIKFVVYGGQPQLARYDRVMSDHESGSYQLARWLISQGRRRILLMRSDMADAYWLDQRYAGYKRAMEEKGLEVLDAVTVPFVQPCGDEAEFAEQVRTYAGYLVEHLTAAESPDAIMADTDGHVYRLAAACRLFGKEPNKDIVLTGYDNSWEQSKEAEYEEAGPVATADKQNWDMGQALFDLLLDRINGKLPPEPQCRVVQPKLIVLDNNKE